MSPSTYPVVLTDLAGARCVVVGGGAVAERKVAGLLEAGARPLVVSPTLTLTLAGWRAAGRIDHHPRVYGPDDLCGAVLAIAATGDPAVNARVAADARSQGLLVNVADRPERGNFHTVATVRRGDLLLTVSTGGQSPTVAASVRDDLVARYGPEYGRALAAAAALRSLSEAELPHAARSALVAWLCSEQALAWLREGSDDLVASTLQRAIASYAEPAEVAA